MVAETKKTRVRVPTYSYFLICMIGTTIKVVISAMSGVADKPT